MKRKFVQLSTERTAYEPSQIYIDSTLTVKELIEILEDMDENAPVIFSNDRGYTYGALTEEQVSERWGEWK